MRQLQVGLDEDDALTLLLTIVQGAKSLDALARSPIVQRVLASGKVANTPILE